MMEIGIEDLADIFQDPLINDLTDNLLNDIDISELADFSNECVEPTDTGLSNNENSYGKSNHATLEALLKSQPPRTCVPPAPDLNSGINLPIKRGALLETHPNYHSWDPTKQRSSNPIPIPHYSLNPSKLKGESARVSPSSRLICDYLDKRSNDSQSRCMLRPSTECSSNQSSSYGLNPNQCPDWGNVSNPRRSSHGSKGLRIQGSTSAWNPGIVSTTHASSVSSDSSSHVVEKTAKRAPHNAIEKRYRASINGRIDELRKILIPFPSADAKLNKSAVLRQAIERIKELEEKNERLQAEVMLLRRLHADHVAKSENNSPESGISLDPSPTSSNCTGLEFGRLTPPLAGDSHGGSLYNSNGTVPTVASTASPTELTSQTDFKDPSCATPWSFTLSSPEKSDSTGLSSTNSCARIDSLFDEYTYDRAQYPSGSEDSCVLTGEGPVYPLRVVDVNDHGYALVHAGPAQSIHPPFDQVNRTSGTRGKRTACAPNCGPPKVRRQLVLSSVPTGAHSYVTGPDNLQTAHLPYSNPDSYHATAVHAEPLPGVHRVLSQPVPAESNSLTTTYKAPDVHDRIVTGSSGGSLHDVAARTTLCVSALCLIALDPSVLTSTGSSTESQGTGGASTTRRLLTISSSSWTSSFSSSWINCALYLLQWLMALFFCFWAWKRGARRNTTRRKSSSHTLCELSSARAHWTRAKAAIDQGALTLTEKNLHACLLHLGEPWTHIPVEGGFGNRIAGYFGLSCNLITLCCVRVPYRLCKLGLTRLITRLVPTRRSASCTSSKNLLTAPVIRSRLLELYLLAREQDTRPDTLLMDPLCFARLFLRCCRDFIDSPPTVPPDQFMRQGVVLALVARKIVRIRPLTRVFLRWTASCLSLRLDTERSSFWYHVVTDPSLMNIFVSPSESIALPPVVVCKSTVLYRFPDRLQNALHKQLLVRCLQTMLYASHHRELVALRPSIEALLVLTQCVGNGVTNLTELPEPLRHDCATSDGSTLTSIAVINRNRWWSKLLHAVWVQRTSRFNPATNTSVATVDNNQLCSVEPPSETVLCCPRAGALAQALWLVYGQPKCQPDSAKQACQLLRQSMQCMYSHRSQTGQSVVGDLTDAFQMTAWQWLALDRVLVAVIDTLMRTHESNDTAHRDMGHTELMACLTAALHMLRLLANPPVSTCAFKQPRWIQKNVSYAEALHRLAIGANPVRTRLALLQYRQTVLTKAVSPVGQDDLMVPQTSNLTLHCGVRRPSTPSQDSGLEMLDHTTDPSEDESEPIEDEYDENSACHDVDKLEENDDGIGGLRDRRWSDDAFVPIDSTNLDCSGKIDVVIDTQTLPVEQVNVMPWCVPVNQSPGQ